MGGSRADWINGGAIIMTDETEELENLELAGSIKTRIGQMRMLQSFLAATVAKPEFDARREVKRVHSMFYLTDLGNSE